MNLEPQSTPPQVHWVEITEHNSQQRLDNFLITRLKGVPKSLIYRIVRKGEVRVNKGRVDVNYRLNVGDIVRIPPVRQSESDNVPSISPRVAESLKRNIIFEDDAIILINKPAGFAVHGGSGIDAGVIEGLRSLSPEQRFLELVHRLDRDTSGCLLIAKKRSALRGLHEQFRDDTIEKTYLALLSGKWAKTQAVVDQPLLKNVNKGGERFVVISKAGKASITVFTRLKIYANSTLVRVAPKTGRTHQIRVHAAYLNHPIVGDPRYGFEQFNSQFKGEGYPNMFLHAETLAFRHPLTGKNVKFSAPLPQHFSHFIEHEKQI